MLLEPQQAITNDTLKTVQMIEELISKVPAIIKSSLE